MDNSFNNSEYSQYNAGRYTKTKEAFKVSNA